MSDETRPLPQSHPHETQSMPTTPAAGAPTAGTGQTPPPQPPLYNATQEPAKEKKTGRRSLAELVTVGVIAGLIGTGGTLAVVSATDSNDTSTNTSVTATTTSAATDQAISTGSSDSTVNWNATAKKVTPSVVAITVNTNQGGGQGSGVIIDKDGHVLTNNHVVDGGQNGRIIVTLSDGRGYEASIEGTDPATDLAVLTLKNPPKDLTPITIGDSDKIAVGDPTMAVGNPLGLAGTVTTGIVSALDRPVTTQESNNQNPFGPQVQSDAVVTNAIQTSAAINPGNSGGALVDSQGRLIGINSSIASLGSSGGSQSGNIGIGFAIPANSAKMIADQLIANGSAKHSYLGINLTDGTEQVDGAYRTGAKVAKVVDNTPAADAGIKTGDLVIAFDGQSVEDSTSLIAHVREQAVGSKVTLTVVRNGKTQDITATLAAR
ncbi:S1C family serine protease [Kribbia dieselivorans]|uniref:S1C family serine protease n=1 Tax=Kribbia dieselivorans TaxID=331526 RepID=UPI0009FACDE0|nr:trypsin-like peptidase domain-containing protein [Kribbia dieselivorans]